MKSILPIWSDNGGITIDWTETLSKHLQKLGMKNTLNFVHYVSLATYEVRSVVNKETYELHHSHKHLITEIRQRTRGTFGMMSKVWKLLNVWTALLLVVCEKAIRAAGKSIIVDVRNQETRPKYPPN